MVNEYQRDDSVDKKILLSAFGIHAGGGLVLLSALIKGLNGSLKMVSLDSRCIVVKSLILPNVKVNNIRKSFTARILAICRLGCMTLHGDTLLCFNSLPPLIRPKGRVIVFVQAPHFVGAHRGIRYSWLTAFRIKIERLWFRLGVKNCDEIWVQTVGMQEAMRTLYPRAFVKVAPLVDDELAERLSLLPVVVPRSSEDAAQYTFFYPADAVGHKNHENLLKAWEILAEKKRNPVLILTLRLDEIEQIKTRAQLNGDVKMAIVNLGWLSRDEVLNQLRKSSALIFPSRAETFGLPLLEARALGIPILASERDFVRDVCIPSQTFDPDSPRSIAMAVSRFIDGEYPLTAEYHSAEKFGKDIFS
ncbi:MAG: glycosyltransferase [Glaciimonas sp.]|nr:glycosyltransferase [Glaciimonas sp.]